jgi:DNA-binding LacI/PurR family transcriptional regulator
MVAELKPGSRPAGRRGPSMLDVARLAGVSGQTVSRVANGRENVDAATRERVLTAMRELGYRPNRAARALRSGHFRTIAVIVFELSSFGTTRSLDAIATAAAARGYTVNLIPVLGATEERLSNAFSELDEQAVDGAVILIEAHLLDEIRLPEGIPTVIVDSSALFDYPIVDTDQAQGARQATEHLLDLGHETVWHVSGPPESYSAIRRRASWEETLVGRRRPVPPVLAGDWTVGSGYRAGLELARSDDVTAVFAANDQMALGVLHALHERGREVPADVSVVGFDDMEESAHFWPPLTTIRQSFGEVGRATVDALISEIQSGEHHNDPVRIGTELVVRNSTATPRSTTG